MTGSALPGPEAFRPHIGTDFTIEEGAQQAVLRLAEVSDSGVSNGMHQFSLFFHGPADRILPERIHALRHPSLGILEIFIAPVVGSNDRRTVYQACFSRPADSVHEGPR